MKDGKVVAITGASSGIGQLRPHTQRRAGGGKVLALLNAIDGIAKGLRLFAGLAKKRGYKPVLLRFATIDGLPGYVSMDRGVLQTTALEIRGGRIAAVYIVRNPEKLQHIAQLRIDGSV